LKGRTDIVIYAALTAAFFVYKTLEFNCVSPIIFSSYFEDLLALPLVLKTALLFTQVVFKYHRSFTMNRLEAMVILALFSLYFEAAMPLIDYRFMADPVDVFCYCAGLLVFMRWLNKPLVPKDSSLIA
jgi:hypothetical protein